MSRTLITGAGRGIGLALANELLSRGHMVVGSVRTQAAAEALSANLGPGFTALVFDVNDQDAVREAARDLDGSLDVLVNNAGIIGERKPNTVDYDDFDEFAQILSVNTIAPLRVCQAFLPHLREGIDPKVLTISSQMGMLSNSSSNCIAYRASKAAVNKVMQGLATDLRSEGIAVQMLQPGWVRSDMGGSSADISVEESASGIADRIETLSLDQTGAFLNYDGSPMQW